MIQKLNDEVMTLKRQTHLLLERVRKLETCLTIADENSCQSVSGGTHAEHLEAKIKVLKEEREDNYKKIVELTSKLDQEKIRGDSNYDAVQKTRAELAGWHEVFGTKHLSHAKAARDAGLACRKNAEDANEWQANKIKELNEELCRVIKERDHLKAEVERQATAITHAEVLEAERDEAKADVELFKRQLVKANQDCLDAKAEARDTTTTDSAIKLLEKLAVVAKERDQLKAELAEAIRKNSYGCASEQDFVAFRNRQYELEQERDELKAEVERQANNNKLLLVNQEHEEQTREFLRCEAETLKAQVSELINQRDQLLKEKQNTCPNCKEEVAFWADHIHSLPNQATSYSCFSSQQLKAEVERLKELHIMQLAAISFAANSNTDSTIDESLKCHPDYKSVALSVVVAAVQREIWERKEKKKWHDMAREAAHCCNEAAAYGTCDCDLENDPYPCVFCEANKVVAGFNDMEKGTK